jgi:hypothetical protein
LAAIKNILQYRILCLVFLYKQSDKQGCNKTGIHNDGAVYLIRISFIIYIIKKQAIGYQQFQHKGNNKKAQSCNIKKTGEKGKDQRLDNGCNNAKPKYISIYERGVVIIHLCKNTQAEKKKNCKKQVGDSKGGGVPEKASHS